MNKLIELFNSYEVLATRITLGSIFSPLIEEHPLEKNNPSLKTHERCVYKLPLKPFKRVKYLWTWIID